MAKEQIHNYLRTGIVLATIIFAGGGYTMKINDNSQGVSEGRKERKVINEKVHSIQLSQAEDLAVKQAMLNTLTRMESKIDTGGVERAQMKLDINSTKIRIETLTKDE